MNAFELWGIAIIGEIFICVGKLPLIFVAYQTCLVLEDNARGLLNSNSNSPSDFCNDGNTILLGAPKTTRKFNLTA